VATNVLGASGRAMLEGLLSDGPDPARLADLARGRLREKLPELERALTGRVGAHQRFLVAAQLAHVDFLDDAITHVSAEIRARLAAHREALARLDTIPGVGEIGTDMARFPTARHLASWAGMCPGNHASAGKRLSGRTRRGSPWLRSTLIEAAQAAARTKGSYLSAQYHRLAARRGKKKAAVAVGHTILIIAYHLHSRGRTYDELGAGYFDARDRRALEQRLVRRLERLGYKVALEPDHPAA
jgi:transposase